MPDPKSKQTTPADEPPDASTEAASAENPPPATPPTPSVLCPHCDEPLREHHDTLEALHCDSLVCIACCWVRDEVGKLLHRGPVQCLQTGPPDKAA